MIPFLLEKHHQTQESSFIASEHSQIIQQGNLGPDVKQTLRTQYHGTAETLQQINAKFDSSYFSYNCWLFLMIFLSAFSAVSAIEGTFIEIRNYGTDNDFLYLFLLVAFNAAFFAQFLLEKWAISTRNLAKANLALKIISINTLSFLALNIWTGHSLYDYTRNIIEPSESTASHKATLIFCFVFVSFLSVTQIFITHLQAIKVQNDLTKIETINQIQNLFSMSEEHSQIIQEENQVESTAEPVPQRKINFNSSSPCYNFWLGIMTLISGFSAFCKVTEAFISIKNFGIGNDFLYLMLSVAISTAFFAQFIVEQWAIYTQDLAKANLAIKVTTGNAFSLLTLNAWAGYYLYDYSGNITKSSEGTAFTKFMLSLYLIVFSFLSVTQIFITHFQAIQVRNDLMKRVNP